MLTWSIARLAGSQVAAYKQVAATMSSVPVALSDSLPSLVDLTVAAATTWPNATNGTAEHVLSFASFRTLRLDWREHLQSRDIASVAKTKTEVGSVGCEVSDTAEKKDLA